MYDYSKLNGLIKEKFGTQKKVAEKIGLSSRSMSLKMTGKRFFQQDEISSMCKLLGIASCDIYEYFFTPKVLFDRTI